MLSIAWPSSHQLERGSMSCSWFHSSFRDLKFLNQFKLFAQKRLSLLLSSLPLLKMTPFSPMILSDPLLSSRWNLHCFPQPIHAPQLQCTKYYIVGIIPYSLLEFFFVFFVFFYFFKLWRATNCATSHTLSWIFILTVYDWTQLSLVNLRVVFQSFGSWWDSIVLINKGKFKLWPYLGFFYCYCFAFLIFEGVLFVKLYHLAYLRWSKYLTPALMIILSVCIWPFMVCLLNLCHFFISHKSAYRLKLVYPRQLEVYMAFLIHQVLHAIVSCLMSYSTVPLFCECGELIYRWKDCWCYQSMVYLCPWY